MPETYLKFTPEQREAIVLTKEQVIEVLLRRGFSVDESWDGVSDPVPTSYLNARTKNIYPAKMSNIKELFFAQFVDASFAVDANKQSCKTFEALIERHRKG